MAILMAAFNYALTGEGLKDNVIKIGKSFLFFAVLLQAYPMIISGLSAYTYKLAYESVGESALAVVGEQQGAAQALLERNNGNIRDSYGNRYLKSGDYFGEMLVKREVEKNEYTTIAPGEALKVLLLVAADCFAMANDYSGFIGFDLVKILFGMICGLAVIVCGALALLEYLMAYLEYALVTSVGVILLPLMIWEGSKFLSESLIKSIIGFALKLLFCNIAIFMMLYGFMTLAVRRVDTPFLGTIDEFLVIIFVSLLYYLICSKGPSMAASLLTGSPQLSGGHAISAAKGAVAGAAMVAGGGAALAARGGFAGAGMVNQAGAAAGAVKELGGSKADQAKAAMKSLGGSAMEAMKSGGGNLARSLLRGGKGGGGGSGGGAGEGYNRHSQREQFLRGKNAEGARESFGENMEKRRAAGRDIGLDYMAKKEADSPESRIRGMERETEGIAADIEKDMKASGYSDKDIEAELSMFRKDPNEKKDMEDAKQEMGL
jgi:hypothetical protein